MAVINVTAEASDSTRTYIKTGGHSIVIDEPPLFGGEDTAPSPVAVSYTHLDVYKRQYLERAAAPGSDCCKAFSVSGFCFSEFSVSLFN